MQQDMPFKRVSGEALHLLKCIILIPVVISTLTRSFMQKIISDSHFELEHFEQEG